MVLSDTTYRQEGALFFTSAVLHGALDPVLKPLDAIFPTFDFP